MSDTLKQLTTHDHSRDAAGLRYVYPVISRRSGGLSVGININTDNRCNWRCVYCQVPGLARGDAPPVDLPLLRRELGGFLIELRQGGFATKRLPEGARRIVDVAISGNGEPTTAREFPEVVALALEVMRDAGLAGSAVPRLITNGSRVRRAPVMEGLRRLGAAGGEVWFKLDAGSPEWISRINGVSLSPAAIARNLNTCANLCPTWVQTCAFGWKGRVPLGEDLDAYADILRKGGVGRLRGVHLYGLARPSRQPEAAELVRLPPEELEALAERIRTASGLAINVCP